MPAPSTDTAADKARISLETALRSGDGFRTCWLLITTPNSPAQCSTSTHAASARASSSACLKNTKAKAERVNGALGDNLRAFDNGRKDD